MSAGDTPERAWKGYVHRTIPTDSVDVATATLDLTPYIGRYIYLEAVATDAFIRRGAAAATTSHFPLKVGTLQELYVDPEGNLTLQRTGGNVRIHFDVEIV